MRWVHFRQFDYKFTSIIPTTKYTWFKTDDGIKITQMKETETSVQYACIRYGWHIFSPYLDYGRPPFSYVWETLFTVLSQNHTSNRTALLRLTGFMALKCICRQNSDWGRMMPWSWDTLNSSPSTSIPLRRHATGRVLVFRRIRVRVSFLITREG